MRAAPCTYRPARLLWRRDVASNHRGLVDRSGVAPHVQQIPTVPRRRCRRGRIPGPADDSLPSKLAIETFLPNVGVTPPRFLFAQLFVALLLRADLLQHYRWYQKEWVTTILIVSNLSVVFSEPAGVLVGQLLDAAIRRVSANYDAELGGEAAYKAACQASKRNTASAERRVLEEDRKILIAQLRHEECCEAMATAAQKGAVGAEACLAVQHILYQSSTVRNISALELVAPTATDDGTDDGDSDLESDPFHTPLRPIRI